MKSCEEHSFCHVRAFLFIMKLQLNNKHRERGMIGAIVVFAFNNQVFAEIKL